MAGPITWRSFYDQQLNADSQPSANGGMTQTRPSRVRQRVAGAAFTNPYLPGKLGTFSHADRKRQVSFQIERATAILLHSSPRRMLNSDFLSLALVWIVTGSLPVTNARGHCQAFVIPVKSGLRRRSGCSSSTIYPPPGKCNS
jgi:hypothetical protein